MKFVLHFLFIDVVFVVNDIIDILLLKIIQIVESVFGGGILKMVRNNIDVHMHINRATL